MKMIDSRLQDVVSLMREIKNGVSKMDIPHLSKEELDKGYESSYLGSRQPNEVSMTPLMKNALIAYGDMKDGSKYRLKVNDPETKAEKAIVDNMKQLLLRFNGTSSEYDDSLPIFDKRHYDVQCHQNLKENMRDIQPGQAKQRIEMSQKYTTPTSNSIDQVIKLIETDVVFQKAIQIIMDSLPMVKASNEIREINLPFMTKHTGVGAYFWQNDRTIDPKTGKTYAELTMSIAESIKEKPNEWDKYNISTMYGRNQRGKGRLLIAVSRILNLLLNMLEGVEIPTYKERCSMFVGYKNDQELKKALIQIGQDCESHGLKCANEDYSSFDSTIGQGILALVGAISILKANGSKSKLIAKKRAIYAQQTLLLNGLTKKQMILKGRIFSGFIDTNRGGGIANAIQMLTCCMDQDEKYSNITYDLPFWMLVMGDDNLHVYKTLDRKKLSQDMKRRFGGIINESKYEYGPVFLQYRTFKDPKTNEIVMAYAWTRVVRSMLMKEQQKGLGPVGWTYAFYQQLAKLVEFDEAFYIAVNLLVKFDKNKFFMDTPIPELNKMLKKEDDEAYAKLKTDAQKRRFQTTWERLMDGDPSKARFIEGSSLLDEIQSKIREVYDPNFYSKYGLR